MEILGILGTLILAVAGIPQLIRTLRDGHADGLSGMMVGGWVFGCFLLLIYALDKHSEDYILIFNYGLNFLMALIMGKYKFGIKLYKDKMT